MDKKIEELKFCSMCENFKILSSTDEDANERKHCLLTNKIIFTAEQPVLEINDKYLIKNKDNNCIDFIKKKSFIKKLMFWKSDV